MPTEAHLIIDGRSDGLPHAPGYYAVFAREPTPLGDDLTLSLSGARTTVLQNTSLDAILDVMLKVGAGAVVMLVCHAFRQGMLFPIVPNGKRAFAESSNLGTLEKTISAETEAAQIKAMPTATDKERAKQLERWGRFLNGLQPNMISGNFTAAQAEATYDKWLDMVAGKLEFAGAPPRDELRKLLDKVRRVRLLKLARLELRACNIGDQKSAMEVVRKFFNCSNVTAPTVGTFFTSLIIPESMAMFRESAQPTGTGNATRGRARVPGPIGTQPRRNAVSAGLIMAQTDNTTRGFLRERVVPLAFSSGGRSLGVHLGAIYSFFTFTLTVNEVSAFHYNVKAFVKPTPDGRRQDWQVVREFIKGWITPSSSYSSGAFPVAGFWTPDIQDVPFVLPFETMYVRLIETVP